MRRLGGVGVVMRRSVDEWQGRGGRERREEEGREKKGGVQIERKG